MTQDFFLLRFSCLSTTYPPLWCAKDHRSSTSLTSPQAWLQRECLPMSWMDHKVNQQPQYPPELLFMISHGDKHKSHKQTSYRAQSSIKCCMEYCCLKDVQVVATTKKESYNQDDDLVPLDANYQCKFTRSSPISLIQSHLSKCEQRVYLISNVCGCQPKSPIG